MANSGFLIGLWDELEQPEGIVVFIDNNAVRDALIKGFSPICDI